MATRLPQQRSAPQLRRFFFKTREHSLKCSNLEIAEQFKFVTKLL
ncbi:hypothetical protein Trichorick_01070 [Candidatus Trichorickettsia mobilis]|uniref:Uncharacterized protein n=1 Tax=Candidatus Trichorickettsia mobilis TaxID=1346319 RepID=A0ABZ0UUI8_9RICK|nr:hypothetical protein Trichorick_01070 [Candidatus Trichorickettsia mobilis]